MEHGWLGTKLINNKNNNSRIMMKVLVLMNRMLIRIVKMTVNQVVIMQMKMKKAVVVGNKT